MTTDPQVSEFFTAGGTLPPDAPSYVKRPTDDDLFRHIMAGEFCYVLTPRQMGKSSLMIRTAQRLSKEGVKSGIVDLTQIGTVHSEDQWYKGILTQIARRLRLTVDPVSWWEQKKDIPNIQKFIEFFEEALFEFKEHVVIFMDEIDTTLKLDFRDNFFAGIRAIFNARATNPNLKRITFVLLGVASPSDLIKDRNRTPFNIGQEILLKPFSREDARMLEKGLEDVYPKLGRKILDRIFYWTNGHPYLTQKICQSIVENRLNEYEDEEIDTLVERLFISQEASRETNLQFVRDNILSYPERRVILSLYKKLLRGATVRDNKNSLPQNHLKLSGLARVEEEKLAVSNKIYGKVFDQRWVNRYTELNWPIITSGILGFIVIVLLSVFYHDSWILEGQAENYKIRIAAYQDYRGIEALANLYQLDPIIFLTDYKDQAKRTFFTLNWEKQEDLLKVTYGEIQQIPPEQYEPQYYRIVVAGLYTSLADVDKSGQTKMLLEIMQSSLEETGWKDDKLYQEITHWLKARKNASDGDLPGALAEYTEAININLENLNPNDPNPNAAILFERARIYAQLGDRKQGDAQQADYQNALADYEQAIASVRESTGATPSSTAFPSETPLVFTPPLSLTGTQTLTPSLAFTSTPTIVTPILTILPTITSQPIAPAALTPTITPPPSPTQTPTLNRIQPGFLNRQEIIAAIESDLDQNETLFSYYQRSIPADYPNLATNVPIVTATPTNTLALTSSVLPSIETPTIAANITPSPVPPSSILLQEDFEDGKADGWGRAIDTDYVGDWSIEEETNGNHFWSGTGPTNWPQNWYGDATLDWTDYAFESRIQFVTGGTLFICIRSNGGTAFYTVYINDTSINYAQANRLKGVEFSSFDDEGTPETFVRNRWYTIRVELKGNTLSTYVDNVLVRARELPSPILNTQGGIGYYMGGGDKFYIDDIRVWSLSESHPTPILEPFPMTADAYNITNLDDGTLLYYTKLSLEDAIRFYRDEYTAKGYTEREALSVVSDGVFSIVFDGDPSGKAIVIQSVDLGDGSRTVTVRLEDV